MAHRSGACRGNSPPALHRGRDGALRPGTCCQRRARKRTTFRYPSMSIWYMTGPTSTRASGSCFGCRRLEDVPISAGRHGRAPWPMSTSPVLDQGPRHTFDGCFISDDHIDIANRGPARSSWSSSTRGALLWGPGRIGLVGPRARRWVPADPVPVVRLLAHQRLHRAPRAGSPLSPGSTSS